MGTDPRLLLREYCWFAIFLLAVLAGGAARDPAHDAMRTQTAELAASATP
jgi:hypothetical protein